MAYLQIRVNVGRSTSFHCTNSNLLNGAQWQGRRNRGSRDSGCSPTFGAGHQCSPGVCRCDRPTAMIIYRWKSLVIGLMLVSLLLVEAAIRDTNLLEHTAHYVHFNRLAAKWLKTNGFIFGTKVYMPTTHTLHTGPPKYYPKMANISVFSWCIAAKLLSRHLSAAAYGCALLLLVGLTFAFDELAVWGYRAPERTFQATELARNRITPLGGRYQHHLVV